MRFEVWLIGNTLSIQKHYWQLLKQTKWNENINEMPQYSILEAVIINSPDFNDLELLFEKIHDNVIGVSDEIITLLAELKEP